MPRVALPPGGPGCGAAPLTRPAAAAGDQRAVPRQRQHQGQRLCAPAPARPRRCLTATRCLCVLSAAARSSGIVLVSGARQMCNERRKKACSLRVTVLLLRVSALAPGMRVWHTRHAAESAGLAGLRRGGAGCRDGRDAAKGHPEEALRDRGGHQPHDGRRHAGEPVLLRALRQGAVPCLPGCESGARRCWFPV